ncbi:helix-turn-helix transcriptional regulator [Paenibacillus larvae]
MKDIKMVDMAKELGVSTTYLAEILKGTRKGTKQKPKIAEMLGMGSEVTTHQLIPAQPYSNERSHDNEPT